MFLKNMIKSPVFWIITAMIILTVVMSVMFSGALTGVADDSLNLNSQLISEMQIKVKEEWNKELQKVRNLMEDAYPSITVQVEKDGIFYNTNFNRVDIRYNEQRLNGDGDLTTVAGIDNWPYVWATWLVQNPGTQLSESHYNQIRNLYFAYNPITSREGTVSRNVQPDLRTHEETGGIVLIHNLNEKTVELNLTERQKEEIRAYVEGDRQTLFNAVSRPTLVLSEDLTNIVSNLPSNSKGADVVRKAITKAGCPYHFSSTSGSRFGPYSFDCSGLVGWAISQVDPVIGSNFYTTAAGQAEWCRKNGKNVGKSELQPGDLVFWSKTDCSCGRSHEIHHVGIYVGGGQALEASSGKNAVIVRNLWEGTGYRITEYARPY